MVYSNFIFLEQRFPALEKMGSLSESYLYSDPNACLYKMGILAETLVNYMFELDSLKPPKDNTQANRITALLRDKLIPKEIGDILNKIRKKRNDAVHEGYEPTFEECRTLLELTYTLTIWFMQTYGDHAYEQVDFVMPEDRSDQADYYKLLDENEKLAAELEKAQAAALSELVRRQIHREERRQRAERAAGNIKLSERETRYLIDEQLRKIGWEADAKNLRYAKGTRPEAGRNIAIADWPTDSAVCKWGYADYALFAGQKLVGVVDAKSGGKDISSAIDNQCREYSQGIKEEHRAYLIDTWGDYKAPFLFAANGRPYDSQRESRSGVWFRDARDEANIPKAMQGWFAPQGLLDMLEKDITAANRKLAQSSFDLLRDKDGLNLRPYQIEAVEKAEMAVAEGRQTILLAMAAGTGKTRTILGMIYRFLKTGRFQRILYLVDRAALGEQTLNVFREIRIEDLLTMEQIYEIKKLDDKELSKVTKIHVATVQSLVKGIVYNDTPAMPSVADYDLIVVDEAHRGYLQDLGMGAEEWLYKNQSDYVSKYRSVIDYFDAVKIAFTTTPALHTAGMFGKPVFEYSYRRAVIEGYLADHEAPHEICAKLREDGPAYPIYATSPIYDPATGEITNSDELEDELKFGNENLNSDVIKEGFCRAVFEEIARDINPEGDGKTLIFAVDDNHADLIVRILKEFYEPAGVSGEAVMKITGGAGMGNPKKVMEAVKRFKNEHFPSVVVTVDLLTTGIDVPEITTLVFMRRVSSRVLFEQMLGRAARLCPAIGKSHFEIYDPVGAYELLAPVNTMKPVAQKQTASTEDQSEGLRINDESTRLPRGYGQGWNPQDYLDEFGVFIDSHINAIPALELVCTQPQALTREGLKSLRLELAKAHFTEKQLNAAWQELKNEDITADIISFIRQYTLGSALISHQERIRNAVEKLRRQYSFTNMEDEWLVYIEKNLIAETVIDRETFDAGAFKARGGFARADKIFGGMLEDYLRELNSCLYDDGGKTA